jgi:N utilization substance protein A
MIVEDGEVIDPLAEIAYSDAVKIEPDFEVGEELYQEVNIIEFGRRAILAAKQTLASRISDLKKNVLLKKYSDRIGDIINADVHQVWKKEVLLLDEDGNELILPKSEQIPQDYFKKGESVRAVVARVDMKNNTPVIILSRTSPLFLAKLLEIEVPEIFDGLITIKKIVREPGERAKVAVESFDDRIDPVGACVGMKGSRIHGIVRELKNENIDVINYTTNIQLLIQRSLTPAKISFMNLDNEKKQADVYLKADQVSLAIGRRGVNIKLACELTGYEIDVYREEEEQVDEFDIDLDEFSDEIEQWIIDEFKRVGCDTAQSVLKLSDSEIERRTDLEKETIAEVRQILQAEFDRDVAE